LLGCSMFGGALFDLSSARQAHFEDAAYAA
jgi:hypothetical protein